MFYSLVSLYFTQYLRFSLSLRCSVSYLMMDRLSMISLIAANVHVRRCDVIERLMGNARACSTERNAR